MYLSYCAGYDHVCRRSPMEALPPEVLAHIFALLTYDLIDTSSEDIEQVKTWKKLICCSRVCKYWRDVIMNTPVLWSYIPLLLPTEFDRTTIREMLKLSRQVPLTFQTLLLSDDDMDIVSQETHRIQILYCFCAMNKFVPTVRLHDAPSLATLHVVATGLPGTFEPGLVPFVDPQCPLTQLQHFSVVNIQYSSLSCFFRPTLKTLSIGFDQERKDSPSIASFLCSLQNMPLLEELTVLSLFKSKAFKVPTEEMPPVRLQYLRELAMSDDIGAIACILDHLEVPESMFLDEDKKLDVQSLGAADQAPAHSAAVVAKLMLKGVIGTPSRSAVTQLKVFGKGSSGTSDQMVDIIEGWTGNVRMWRFDTSLFPIALETVNSFMISSPLTDLHADPPSLTFIQTSD